MSEAVKGATDAGEQEPEAGVQEPETGQEPDGAAQDTGDAAEEDRPGRRPAGVWSVDEHIDDILRQIRPLEPLEMQLLDAQGCVLVEDVTAAVALPPFDNSSMDGYAVRTVDVEGASDEFPAVLRVVGDVPAGGGGELPHVGAGEAARIMTGAPLPPGTQAVVPVEWTDGGTGRGRVDAMRPHSESPAGAGGAVRIYEPAGTGRHVRTRGSDVLAGDLVLRAGTVLGPAQIGLLAAIGRGTVRVRPRPRVVVLSTGSELVPPGEQLAPGRIHDSNSYALTAAARDAGAIAYRVGAVADDAETLRATVEDQLIRADALVTSGGVSVGAYDVVKEALAELDGEAGGGVEFRRLAMQPGKPQGFGRIGADRTPLFALPGNPVSAYISFEMFVRPVIRRLMGVEPVQRPVVRARLAGTETLTSPAGRRQFLRGWYEHERADGGTDPGGTGTGPGGPGPGAVTPVGGSGSHLIAALARANALVVVPEETTEVTPGAPVDVVLLD
ncbi:molybdotransferase-like divisome protein Glp [Streptomyces sp. NBC_01808]|uniref:molybdotransferase-like divisome protein Glp n=1 Tax=Streptomyces sp. NBC_01808 TaxID=2975947 RepID=UPI003FA367D2